MQSPHPLVVFSHLRWDFVYQRPQHIMSRMAAGGRPVVFIEEPEYVPGGRAQWKRSYPASGVLVARPQIGFSDYGFGESQQQTLIPMVRNLLANEGVTDFIAWLYTRAPVYGHVFAAPRYDVFRRTATRAATTG